MRAAEWDQRYAERQQWSTGPNALVAALLADLPPGNAVDLAAGEGRHALWPAGRGWRVTAVDFSAVGLARGQTQPGADRVAWVAADVLTWDAPAGSLDLVLVAYLRLAQDDVTAVLRRAVGWLRPGGRLLVLGHDVDNIAQGWAARRSRRSCTAWRGCPGGGAARRRPARAGAPRDPGRGRARHAAVGHPLLTTRGELAARWTLVPGVPGVPSVRVGSRSGPAQNTAA